MKPSKFLRFAAMLWSAALADSFGDARRMSNILWVMFAKIEELRDTFGKRVAFKRKTFIYK